MKGVFAAAALAALAGSAAAHNHRHAHELFKKGYEADCKPGCTTYIRTIVGEEVGKKLTPIWGIDSEGELRSCWKEIGVPNLWLMMGEPCAALLSTAKI